MKLYINQKDKFPILIDTIFVQINKVDNRGWYISLFSDVLYLHKDKKVYEGIHSTELGFWETKEEALDFYNETITNSTRLDIII